MKSIAVTVALLMVACRSADPGEVVTAECRRPAPLLGADTRANPSANPDEYLVMFRPGYSAADESQRLAAKYGFMVTSVFWIVPAFAADLTSAVVAQLQCEPSVETIQFSRTNIPPPSGRGEPKADSGDRLSAARRRYASIE